jgi:hypothetical protein
MTKTLECEAALSDLVLQAARAAIPADADRLISLPDCGETNQPLLPLLVGLLDATRSVAAAIADNAWDHNKPVDKELAVELGRVAASIAGDIQNATECPDSADWSLPSMTGRELL